MKYVRKGRREGDKGRVALFTWSPAVHHQSLAFLARHYHLLFIVIIPCTIYTLLFLLFLLLSSGYPDVEPPVRRLRLER